MKYSHVNNHTDGMFGVTRYNMGIMEEGIEAEQWILKLLRHNQIECFQPDAISLEEDL